ncbi:MAG: hypothetical protein R2708_17225 [Vicinamibacterales bacterium]
MPHDLDPEIAAMGSIAAALTPLEPEAVRRVLKWAIERFQARTTADLAPSTASMPMPVAGVDRTFLNLADLFDTAQAESGLDKVLVVAYWFQVTQRQDDWDSFAVNTELKHLGHPSTNITRDLDSLMKRSPRLVLQVRKDGTTRQARKRYKLTREGVRAVEKMLGAAENGGAG